MKAIRGATTVERDEAGLVRAAVKDLLSAVKEQNKLAKEDIVAILFSNTGDIRSVYPAKAAREAGFEGCPLFSSAEPDIEGALPLCIRVMILAEGEGKPKPVYLNGAVKLRRDISGVMNIALDGPAGSGKSTIAKALAAAYDILYLDTGAMYRACAYHVLRAGENCKDEEQVTRLVGDIDLNIQYIGGTQHTFLGGEDVSEAIRRPEIAMNASAVSSIPFVRKKMAEMQRKIAASQSCVLDGRDIGSYVIPQTPYKFYVTADSRVRAKRRFDELKAKGFDVDYDKILEEIEARDTLDKTKALAPLVKTPDATEVDTSFMTVDEAVAFIREAIQKKV